MRLWIRRSTRLDSMMSFSMTSQDWMFASPNRALIISMLRVCTRQFMKEKEVGGCDLFFDVVVFGGEESFCEDDLQFFDKNFF